MDILVIGGSAGSLAIVLQILPCLSQRWQGSVILVFHRKDNDNGTLTDILSSRTVFAVKEIEDKEPIAPQTVYVAPADYHVLIERDKSFSLDYSEKVHYCRPSIDVVFESTAEIFGRSMTALLLSGANADGVDGLKAVNKAGGVVVVQDPETAEVPFMPRTAVKNVPVDFILYRDQIENFIAMLPFLTKKNA